MHFVYVIQHSISLRLYIGKTGNLKRRLKEHNSNRQKSTSRKGGKWFLVYVEIYKNKKDADEREIKLKSHGSAKQRIIERIQNSLLKN